ncbi:MAG: hypothetical protein ACO1OB_27270 [Archangium sp.]
MTKFSREEFLAAVANGRVSQLTECSVDDGRTWTTAAAASKWVETKRGSDAGLSLIVPVAVEPRSVIAGYFALGSFFFFGGPVSFVALVMALDTGPKLLVRAGALLVGFVLGPLPIAGVGWWALRAHLADSSKRGAGRAWFALVVAALLTLTLLGGVAGLFLRQP